MLYKILTDQYIFNLPDFKMYKSFSVFIVLLSLLCLTPLQSSGEPPLFEPPKETAERLQLQINSMQSLSFDFFQQTRGEMTGRPRKGSGQAVFYKKDGNSRMRWDYSSPDRQVLVSDGSVFSMYFENLKQMIVSPAETLNNDLTYSFFTGNGNLQKDFLVFPPDQGTGGATEEVRTIKLVPRLPHSQVQDVHLWVTKSSLIRRMNIRDHFGTITVLNLSNIQVNTLVGMDEKRARSFFSFVPPEDTEIIEQ